MKRNRTEKDFIAEELVATVVVVILLWLGWVFLEPAVVIFKFLFL